MPLTITNTLKVRIAPEIVSSSREERDTILQGARTELIDFHLQHQPHFKFNTLVPTPYEPGDESDAAIDWQTDNWGTTEAQNPRNLNYSITDGSLILSSYYKIKFDTLVRPPREWLIKASQIFPGLKFNLLWANNNNENHLLVAEAGVIIYDSLLDEEEDEDEEDNNDAEEETVAVRCPNCGNTYSANSPGCPHHQPPALRSPKKRHNPLLAGHSLLVNPRRQDP